MPYTIRVLKDRPFIILKVMGPITRESTMKNNLTAYALGRDLRINRYLVDLTEARNVKPVLANYQFACRDRQMPERVDPPARVALLVSPNDHPHDVIDTEPRAAGPNVTLFTDLELAIRHLTDDARFHKTGGRTW